MKLKLFYEKSVHENAAYYYEQAKESREKIAGVEKAIKETEKEIEKTKETKKSVRVKKEKEWYERFHHFFTAGKRLVIGGRNAQQNDFLAAKHMETNDLFFHADIQGGSVVILKDGANAGDEELSESAQFAACFSNAWKNANAAVDVYAVRKEQLTKHVTGGFVPAGAFAILGERKWFRNTKLELRIGIDEKSCIALVPAISKKRLQKSLILVPSKSGKEKGALAKSLAKRFSTHPDELLELLPNGKSRTMEM